MTEAVRAWLNGNRNYDDGVVLYLQYGRDTALKQQLRGMETATLRSRLFQELKALVKPNAINLNYTVPKETETVQETQKIGTPPAHNLLERNRTDTEVADHSTNPVVIAAKREADLLYKQLMDVRARMLWYCPLTEDPLENNPGSMKVRGDLAAEVIRLQYKMDEAYRIHDYARVNGKLPNTEPEAPVVEPVKLYQEISNLRKNISRYKRKPSLTAAELSRLQEMEARLPTLLKQYEDAL